MFTKKRPLHWPLLGFILFTSWFLTSCGVQSSNVNWPGLSLAGETVYVAYGPAVAAYNTTTQTQSWIYRPENRMLFLNAPPSVQDGRVILGDYGAASGMFSPKVVVSILGLQENGNVPPSVLWTNSSVFTDKVIAGALQVGDIVYVGGADSRVLALDVNNGRELWRFATGGPVWAQPIYHEGVLYVTSLDRHTYALDAESGNELWQTALGGAISAQPLINPAENLVYVGAYDNALHALDMETGAEKWRVESTNWIWSAPALADGRLYFADSNAQVYAVDAADGAPLWTTAVNQMREVQGVTQQTPVRIDGAIQASPVVADGIVYIAAEGNRNSEEGLLLALDAQTGTEVWQRTTSAPLFTTPVIVEDVIIVAMNSERVVLAAYDLESGSPQWSYLPVLD